VPVTDIRVLAATLRDALACAEPGTFPADACADVAEQLALTEKACAAARVRFAARAAEHGEHYRRGFSDANAWMARHTGSYVGTARTELATMAAVETMPDTNDALRAGEISLAQASEIARLPRFEHELLEVARTQSLRTLKERATRRHLESINRDELAAEQQRRRSVRHRRDEFGMRCGTYAFPPEFGTRFAQRLDRETKQVLREAHRAGHMLTWTQAAADAFQRLFEGTAKTGGGRPEVVFVIGPDVLARGHAHLGEPCDIVGGGPVPVELVRRHLVDAFVKAVIHDGTKVDTIVHYGRRRPALLQSVLDLGDPPDFDGAVCSEDGCDRRFGLQWDHVDPIANGGPTSRDNLAARCIPDHAAKTEQDRAKGLLGSQAKHRKPP
jgi:hypothetical protein